MKCKNCSSNYKTRELRCPYCQTENLLGKIWAVRRSEAEKEYEEAHKETYKKIRSPYMLNRFLNRGLVVMVLAYVLSFAVLCLIFFLGEKLTEWNVELHREEIEIQMAAYYESGELSELYDYMSETCVEFSEYPVYAQAVLLNYDYNRYLEHRLAFEEMSLEEQKEDDYHLQRAISYALEVYLLKCGVYSDYMEENAELCQSLQKEVKAYWLGTLLLTEEELEEMSAKDYMYRSDWEELVHTVKVRRGLL